MRKTLDEDHWFFVDETGDCTFYDSHHNPIIGQEGCSSILGLGFVETSDPHSMRKALASLHQLIASDRYLLAIPSIAKTNQAFHAKDDAPEVRFLVYRCLSELNYKAQFIVARKDERRFRELHHANEDEFYDQMVTTLFENALHRYKRNHICFAQRGSRPRQNRLEEAI